MYKVKLRACVETGHLGTGADEACQHDPGHGERDKSLTAGERPLKIAREATMMGDPGVRPFHHPSLGEHMKPFGHDLIPIDDCSFWCPHPAKTGPRMLDDLETHSKVVPDPLLEGLASIAALSPDQQETRQVSPQSRE